VQLAVTAFELHIAFGFDARVCFGNFVNYYDGV